MVTNSLARSITPVNKESVTSIIINKITELLISQELKPGDQLPAEMQLAQQFNVGRNSVREAIKMLSYMGIIEIKRGVGTFVVESMSADIFNPMVLGLIIEKKTSLELIELRMFIETVISEIVINKASDNDFNKLEEINDRLEKEAQNTKPDTESMTKFDISFHETVLNLTNNTPLIMIGKAIYALFFNSISKTVESDPMLAVSNHRLVIHAFKNRDIEMLRKHLKESLAYWEDFIINN
jgi:DNA-binding FadR family transcriptional regulator